MAPATRRTSLGESPAVSLRGPALLRTNRTTLSLSTCIPPPTARRARTSCLTVILSGTFAFSAPAQTLAEPGFAIDDERPAPVAFAAYRELSNGNVFSFDGQNFELYDATNNLLANLGSLPASVFSGLPGDRSNGELRHRRREFEWRHLPASTWPERDTAFWRIWRSTSARPSTATPTSSGSARRPVALERQRPGARGCDQRCERSSPRTSLAPQVQLRCMRTAICTTPASPISFHLRSTRPSSCVGARPNSPAGILQIGSGCDARH